MGGGGGGGVGGREKEGGRKGELQIIHPKSKCIKGTPSLIMLLPGMPKNLLCQEELLPNLTIRGCL